MLSFATFGRRAGLILTLGLMSAGTLSIACVPGYAVIGLAAPLLVVWGRLLQGFYFGRTGRDGHLGDTHAGACRSLPGRYSNSKFLAGRPRARGHDRRREQQQRD